MENDEKAVTVDEIKPIEPLVQRLEDTVCNIYAIEDKLSQLEERIMGKEHEEKDEDKMPSSISELVDDINGKSSCCLSVLCDILAYIG